MEQRLSLITLGATDLSRARQFYEDGLGWTNASRDDDIAFYQLAGIILAVWGRDQLAEDAHMSDIGAAFSGITIAFNTRSHDEVDHVLAQAGRSGRDSSQACRGGVLGRILRLLRRSRRTSLGGRVESRLVYRRGRARIARCLSY